jgi:DNA-binding NarL/FixJ family response regulator
VSLRVLIVDDDALARSALHTIFDAAEDIDVVGEAADGDQAIEQTARLHPQVILMDIRMPNLDGLQAARRILASPSAACRIVMLTTFDLDEYVYAALQAGASGFLLKDSPPERLIAAVRTVADGDALLAPAITRRLIERHAAPPTPIDADGRLSTLTPRELEVLTLIAKGLSNAEIAAQLYLSEATIKTHVSRILPKLGLRDRAQAVVLAYETGLARRAGQLSLSEQTPP